MWSWKKLPIFLFIPSAASTHTPTFTPIYNFERSTRDWLFQITFQPSHWPGRIAPLKNESSVIFFRNVKTQNPLFFKLFQKFQEGLKENICHDVICLKKRLWNRYYFSKFSKNIWNNYSIENMCTAASTTENIYRNNNTQICFKSKKLQELIIWL